VPLVAPLGADVVSTLGHVVVYYAMVWAAKPAIIVPQKPLRHQAEALLLLT